MPVEVVIPEVGESITEGFLAEWSRADGDMVVRDEPLLVLETDKITMNVNAAEAGQLKILVAEGETVEVGQVVATIDTKVTAPVPAPAEEEKTPTEDVSPSRTPSDPRTAAAATCSSPTVSPKPIDQPEPLSGSVAAGSRARTGSDDRRRLRQGRPAHQGGCPPAHRKGSRQGDSR